MPRYIDADAMIRKICGMKCGCERYECGYDEAGCPKVRDLETAPTISHDEVRGVGRWIEVEQPMGWRDEPCAECSVCGEDFVLGELDMKDIRNLFRFCPNCGAKMEVEGNA